MKFSQRRTRYVRIGFVVLLLVSAAQVTWWIYDQWSWSDEVLQRERALYGALEGAAGALRGAGVPPEDVDPILGELETRTDGALRALERERERRLNQYLWEGGFFLVVLIGGISILARAVRDEALLRRRQDNFLAAVSHELRSPLAASRVAAETLELRDPPAAERARLVGRVIRNLGRLETLVTNLLDAARLEEGRLVLELEPVPLDSVLAPVIAELRDRAAAEGVEVRVELPSRPRLLADPEAVRTVARNLIENAMTAVAEAEKPRIEIEGSARDGRMALSVRDNGRGFEPRERDRIFEKFYRPGDEMRRSGRGAGLGLYLVRELAERQGGDVRASSPGPGAGATFRVEWPAEETAG